jgi:hypothetical protein
MVLLGDHQPPAAVSGEGAPWDVPVHVIASRRELLDGFLARGFRAGLTPARPTLMPMHMLASVMLEAFSSTNRASIKSDVSRLSGLPRYWAIPTR